MMKILEKLTRKQYKKEIEQWEKHIENLQCQLHNTRARLKYVEEELEKEKQKRYYQAYC